MNIAKIQIPLTSGEEGKRVFPPSVKNVCQRLFDWAIPYFNRLSRWSVLQHFMELFRYFTQEVLVKKEYKPSGPNTLEELLAQFDQPQKEKTKEDSVRHYQVFLTMATLEWDMLKMAPSLMYYGHNWTECSDGKAHYDWVPCVVRPEIVFCNYGKN